MRGAFFSKIMSKIFTFLTLFFVWLASVAFAEKEADELEKVRRDRERLIDLVISLQDDFGQTLGEYAQLQDDFAALRNQKDAPDHSAQVAELQKKLKEAQERLEQQKPAEPNPTSHALLEQDLVNLRNELHRERQELLIARARVLRLQQLEKENTELTEKLAAESKSHTKTAADLKAIRAEKEALMGKLEKNMSELKKSQEARDALALRLEAVEKENAELRQKLVAQETRLARLTEIEAEHQKTLAAFANLKAENERLTALVAEREKQLANLREHLAAEVKRTLDIPVLIRARDDLQKKLQNREREATALAQKNEALTSRKAELEADIKRVEENIVGMRTQLEKNKAAMDSVDELTRENNQLKTDKAQLEKTIEMAKAELVKAMGSRNLLEAELAESRKLAASSTELKEMNTALMEEQDLLSNRLQNTEATLKASHQLTDELQASMLTLAKEKADLTKVIESNEAEIKKLRATASKPEMSEELARLEKEKAELTATLAKREDDLKQTRDELGRLQITATMAQKKLDDLKRSQAAIDPVQYNLGATKVATQQTRVLKQIRKILEDFPHARFEIVGHTCDLGNADLNLELSRKRARSLYDFLISQGIKTDHLSHRGVGHAEPKTPNTSEANRRLNRRVEVVILD